MQVIMNNVSILGAFWLNVLKESPKTWSLKQKNIFKVNRYMLLNEMDRDRIMENVLKRLNIKYLQYLVI